MEGKEKKLKEKDWGLALAVFTLDTFIPMMKKMWQGISNIAERAYYSLKYLYVTESHVDFFMGLILGYFGSGFILRFIRWVGDVQWLYETFTFNLVRFVVTYSLILVTYYLVTSKTVKDIQKKLNDKKGAYWKYFGLPISLEEKWVKVVNILNVSLDFSQIQIDDQKNIVKIKISTDEKDNLISIKQATLSDELLTSCYLLPVPNHDKRNVYVSVEGYVYMYIPALIEGRFEELEKYLKENGEYEEMIKGLVEKIGRQSKSEQLVSEKLKSDEARKHA